MTATSLGYSNKSMPQTKAVSKLQENSTAEFKSVLRIRPLLNIRKERNDDEIISLEPVVDAPTVVTLHPQQLSVLPNSNVSTTSSVIGSFPQQLATTQQQDVDYHFDHVLGSDTSQDKVYLSLGLPIAKDLMEQLKQDIDRNGNRLPKSHLVVTMGHAGSGKTYTSIGSSSLSSVRKSEADGLIPRIVESLFSQSKHSVTASTKKKLQFAVMLSVVQVHQSKINPNDSDMYDVLQEDIAKRLVGGTTFSSILQNIDISMNSSNRNKNGSKSTNLVEVQHDTNSCDCVITNLIPRCCTTVEMVRQYLQIALHRSRKAVKKHYQLHMLIQLETVLIDRNDGTTVIHTGGRFAVLDMAAYEGTKQPRSGRSFKDSLPNRDDAHSAILHCLRAIQYNQRQQGGSKMHKKVPFLQNKVTMLLQPSFSPRLNCSVNVILLLALSSSQREYDEKKELLMDLESVHRPSLNATVSTGVADVARTRLTETCNQSSSNHERMPKTIKKQSSKCRKKVSHNPAKSKVTDLNRNRVSDDAGDELSRDEQITKNDDTNAIPIQKAECQKLSQQRCKTQNEFKETSKFTTTEEAQLIEPLPPPVAPHYASRPHLPSIDFSSFQSVDFPGVDTFSNYSPQNTPDFGDVVPSVLKSQDTRSTEREKHCSDILASAPIEDPADDPRYSGAQLLNYMKTFNRMVNASKKKGREVIEKISVSASMNSSSNPNKDAIIDELQTRMMKLDRKNAKLIRENEWLRQQNMQLLHETTELKLSRQRQRTGTNEYGLSDNLSEYDNDSHSSASTHQGDTDSAVCMDQVHLNKGQQVTTLSNDDDHKFELYHRPATNIPKMELVSSMNESEKEQGNSLGDPFFQHVAQLYADEDRETNRWGKVTTDRCKTNSSETMRACNRSDMEASTNSTSGTSLTKPVAKFEDKNNENQNLMHKYEDTNKHPDSFLFEHMAQMDKHW